MEAERKKDAKLTDENREESRRLLALWKNSTHGKSQAAFGAEFDIGSQGMVWQCLNGRSAPISMKAAIGFAKGLGVRIEEFSPRLAREAEMHANAVAPPASADGALPAAMKDLNGIEGQLILLFRGLPSDEQDRILTEVNNAYNATRPAASAANPYAAAPAPGAPQHASVRGRALVKQGAE